MIRRPPISPLFPYPPLSRSRSPLPEGGGYPPVGGVPASRSAGWGHAVRRAIVTVMTHTAVSFGRGSTSSQPPGGPALTAAGSPSGAKDTKSVGEGKRGDLGGRRVI